MELQVPACQLNVLPKRKVFKNLDQCFPSQSFFFKVSFLEDNFRQKLLSRKCKETKTGLTKKEKKKKKKKAEKKAEQKAEKKKAKKTKKGQCKMFILHIFPFGKQVNIYKRPADEEKSGF